MYEVYKTKNILNIQKHCDGGWFWVKYSAYPYTGCEWGCEYCYCRDERYSHYKTQEFEDPFSQYIKIKENAPELLRKSLKNKPKDLIYLDNYQPVETKYRYVREMLKVCLELEFPVFINEKSPLLLQDLDILKKINERSYLNVGWSIITTEDKTRRIFEPKAPSIKSRFNAMKKLADNNIMTGTVFIPILPFICDNKKNIEAVIKKTKECGGEYILDGGLTLNGYCGTHFYRVLGRYNPDLVTEYKKLYANPKLLSKHTFKVHEQVLKYCKKYGIKHYIPRPVSFYPEELQINKKIAEILYLEARELQISGDYREWAYRKAAWSIDDLKESIEKIYREKGIDGLLQIRGIGKKLASLIEEFLNNLKGGENMPKCKDCKFYKPIDETKGDCFGHVVPANMDAERCPTKSFQPK